MGSSAVTFEPDGKTVMATEGDNLLEVASSSGIAIKAVCGGDGVCGKCRVRVKEGQVHSEPSIFLSEEDVEAGVVLACQSCLEQQDVTVEIPESSRTSRVIPRDVDNAIGNSLPDGLIGEDAAFALDPLVRSEHLGLVAPGGGDNLCDEDRLMMALNQQSDIADVVIALPALQDLPSALRENNWDITAKLADRDGRTQLLEVAPAADQDKLWGVAIDVGTTSVVAHLVNLKTAETVAAKAMCNSQAAYGSDVISRMMYAQKPEGRKDVHEAIIGDINHLLGAAAAEAGIRRTEIMFVMCAGNTTMTHFLYDFESNYIRKDPYVPSVLTPPTVSASELGVDINPAGLICALPSVASYVGGDIIADVVVTGMTESDDISLLIDLGTNGELVLGNRDWLTCTSASAGPAFEGGGISCGMRATAGAIETVELDEGGQVKSLGVVGDGKPTGICGSGIIAVVGELLRVGCIDRRGRFVAEKCGELVGEAESGDREFVLIAEEDTGSDDPIVISEADISNFIHTKGSIYMATECLVENVGMTMTDIQHVYVAGGFGSCLEVDKSIMIGLLPDIPHERFKFIGNGSVQGSKMALLSKEANQYLRERVAAAMTYLELSTDHKYMNGYSSTLFLPHTDLEKFPSVA